MDIDFEKYKALQYCDNPVCIYHNQIGQGNIYTSSKTHNQVGCSGCKNRWVLTKGTFFYHLRTPIDKIIGVLKELSEGKGNRAIERTHGVSRVTQSKWIISASEHMSEINKHLTNNMGLSRLQIDEFWSFIKKKMSDFQNRKNLRTQKHKEIDGLL
jgi:hypothetical protein